jgi:hypothetical protein
MVNKKLKESETKTLPEILPVSESTVMVLSDNTPKNISMNDLVEFIDKKQKQAETTPNPNLKPTIKGKFIFDSILEHGAVENGMDKLQRVIKFNPPLVINYEIYDNYNKDIQTAAVAVFDFGLTINVLLDFKTNWLIQKGYEGLTKESSPEDVLMYTLIFDLFHTFCHSVTALNYTYFHWALLGFLQNRATIGPITKSP